VTVTTHPAQTPDPAAQVAPPDHPAEADPQAADRRTRRPGRSRGADRSGWAIAGVAILGLLVLVVVGVGLNTALGALQDMARAVHIDPAAADLYWIGVDGLIVVAIIAAMILRHDPAARRYALGVVALFTIASGVLQYLHGLGWTTPDARSGVVPPLPWGVVLVIALLVIGTIFCGTHLFVHVLRYLFPRALADQDEHPSAGIGGASVEGSGGAASDSDTGDGSAGNERPEVGLLDAETEREVRKWFAAIAVHMILDAGGKPVRAKIARSFGIADRQAGYVIADVVADRDEEAEREAAERAAAVAAPAPAGPVLASAGSVNGTGPRGGATP
jgi:hypothetical protein